MSELSLQELENTAAAYDELLVPALFRKWAGRTLDAAGIETGQRVLDVACGTGVVARMAAARVGPGGSVAGLDINPGMLAVAARSAPGIAWRQGSAEALPYESASFDAVVSQFGLMFFQDRKAALGEMFRVLAPGGRLAVAVFDSLDSTPAYAVMADVFERAVDRETSNALRFPFSLGDTNELSSLFAAAGVASVVTSAVETARFRSVRDMVLADVEGWFPLARIKLDERTIRSVISEAEAALKPFLTAAGAVEFQVAAHIATATRP